MTRKIMAVGFVMILSLCSSSPPAISPFFKMVALPSCEKIRPTICEEDLL